MLIGSPADRAMAGAQYLQEEEKKLEKSHTLNRRWSYVVVINQLNHIVAIAVQKSEFLFTFILYNLASKKSKDEQHIFNNSKADWLEAAIYAKISINQGVGEEGGNIF